MRQTLAHSVAGHSVCIASFCRTTWKPTVISSLQWYVYIPPALAFPTLQHILPAIVHTRASNFNPNEHYFPKQNELVCVRNKDAVPSCEVRYVMHLYVLNRIFLGRESRQVAEVLKRCSEILRPHSQVSPENGDGVCPWNIEEYPHLKTAVWPRRFYWNFAPPKASRCFFK